MSAYELITMFFAVIKTTFTTLNFLIILILSHFKRGKIAKPFWQFSIRNYQYVIINILFRFMRIDFFCISTMLDNLK